MIRGIWGRLRSASRIHVLQKSNVMRGAHKTCVLVDISSIHGQVVQSTESPVAFQAARPSVFVADAPFDARARGCFILTDDFRLAVLCHGLVTLPLRGAGLKEH